MDLLVLNVYITPKDNKSFYYVKIKLDEILSRKSWRNVFIAGDFNSKNSMWGSDINNDWGCDLITFCNNYNLSVANGDFRIPTFSSKNDWSWIDVTFYQFSEDLDMLWKILDNNLNGSLYRSIIFSIRPNCGVNVDFFRRHKLTNQSICKFQWLQSYQSL